MALFPLFYCSSVTTDNFSHNLDAFHCPPGETFGLGFYFCHFFHSLSLRRWGEEASEDGDSGLAMFFCSGKFDGDGSKFLVKS